MPTPICMYSRTYQELSDADRTTVATKPKLLVGMFNSDEIQDIRRRAVGRALNILECLQPQYVYKWDGVPAWWFSYIETSIDRAFQKAAWENDWYLKSIHGDPLSDGGNTYYVNWTPFCPRGRTPDALGLRASQWYARELGRKTKDRRWDSRIGWNGIMFEILADCLGSYGHLDILSTACPRYSEGIRVPEGVSHTCFSGGMKDPLSSWMHAENEAFWRIFEDCCPGLPWWINDNNALTGPSWRDRGRGRKLENWMRKTTDSWDAWEFNADPCYMRGTSNGLDQILYAKHDPRKTIQANYEWMLFALGSALLGDGFFCWTEDEWHPLWDPIFDLDLGAPVGTCFRLSQFWRRNYEKAVVTVSPRNHMARVVPRE